MTSPYRKLAVVPDYPPEPSFEERRQEIERRLKKLEQRAGVESIHPGGGFQIGPMTQMTPELFRDLTREISALRAQVQTLTERDAVLDARDKIIALDSFHAHEQRLRQHRRVSSLWWLYAFVVSLVTGGGLLFTMCNK